MIEKGAPSLGHCDDIHLGYHRTRGHQFTISMTALKSCIGAKGLFFSSFLHSLCRIMSGLRPISAAMIDDKRTADNRYGWGRNTLL
jgi:hypothetical protein